MGNFSFSKKEKSILLKIGEAMLPETAIMPAFDLAAIDRIERFLGEDKALPEMRVFLRAMIRLIDQNARIRYLRSMSGLNPKKRLNYLRNFWHEAGLPKRLSFRMFSVILKAGYLNNPVLFERLGIEYGKPEVKEEEIPRWRSQMLHGREITEDTDLEAEVVVVGSGAGGATVAYQLAQSGNAVIIVEQGDYFNRTHFTGRPFEMQRMMYARNGLVSTLGNVPIVVPLGTTVGGTTTINSGTCFRTPRRILRHWRDDLGLREYTSDEMKPYLDSVEAIFKIAPADMKYVGANGEIIARGAGKLGYSHGPLARNAPDCDGQGICCFGCSTGAKNSTDVSYIPKALESNAQLIYRVRMEEILVRNDEATGIRARSLDTGKQLLIKAPVVVLAGGTIATPHMLMKQKLCNSSGQLGRNLSIHPSTGVYALMDEEVRPHQTIPQGYMVDEFKHEGLMFEGASFPLDSLSLIVPFIGEEHQEIVENYNRLATFGVMVSDTSRGRVLPGIGSEPLLLYNLNKKDQQKLRQGIEILSKIYLAAGALEMFLGIHGWKRIRNQRDLEENLRRRTRPLDMDLSAYHPLGTCHMSGFSDRSVCNPNGETYDVRNLFIADGSLIPPSLGVNPQQTIAAVATRVGDFISNRLSRMTQV